MVNEKRNKSANRERRAHLAGWVLFIVCALFFMAAALKNHDMLTLIGSLIFLIACVVFLVPLMRPAPSEGRSKK